MKIINDSIDLLGLQNLTIKELLSKEENKKILSTLQSEKLNDNIFLKKSKKILAIKIFIEFLIYLSNFFILKHFINESFLSYSSIILGFLIVIIQIALQVNKLISFKYLSLISYFLYFNIYFYFMIIIIYVVNNPLQTQNDSQSALAIKIVLIFIVSSNIYYFYLVIKREKISIAIIQAFNLGLIIYCLKIFDYSTIVLFLFLTISISILAFQLNNKFVNSDNLKIFVIKIINDMVDLNNKLLNENGICQVILKNEKIISNNLLEFKNKNNNINSDINKNSDKENSKNNYNSSSINANLNVTYNETINYNVYEFLSNFILNENYRSQIINEDENEETEIIKDKNYFENQSSEEKEKNKKLHFSKKLKFFSTKEIPASLFKNKIINRESNKQPKTIDPVIVNTDKFFNFSSIDNNSFSNIEFIKKVPTELSDSGNIKIEKIGENIINTEKSFVNEKNENIKHYDTVIRKNRSKFSPLKKPANANFSARSNFNNFKKYKFLSPNNTFNKTEEENNNNNNLSQNVNIESDSGLFQQNLLNVLKSLINKIIKRDSGNSMIINFKNESLNFAESNLNIINNNNNQLEEIKKEFKNNNNHKCTSINFNKNENKHSKILSFKEIGNENKYTFLGNFFKKNFTSDSLLKERKSYDVFYKTKTIKDNVYFDIILKNKQENYTKKQKTFQKLNSTGSTLTNQKTFESINNNNNNDLRNTQFAKLIHEFKTPLNSLLGLTGSLESDISENNKKALRENISFIKGLSEYVIYLISDLTQLCRFSSKSNFNINNKDKKNDNNNNLFDYIVIKTEIGIKDILKFAYQILMTLLKTNDSKRNIKHYFNYDVAIDNLIVYSDEIRLKQILINFISNAVKFTQSGSIVLEASVIQEEKKIKISVLDSGIGIKNENKQKLFKDFSMIENHTEGQKDLNLMGSGLGLSINGALASKLDHKILFDSEYGKGTRFSIELDYNQISRNMSYNDKNKVRLSKPCNVITQNIFEKSKSQKSPKNYRNLTYSVQDSSNFGNQISISGVSEDKKTCTIKDDRMEFNYIISPEDSRREQSELDKSHNISSFSKYIESKKEEEQLNVTHRNLSAKNLSMSISVNHNLNTEKILVVDDNRFTRIAIVKMLQSLFHKLNLTCEIIEGFDGIDILKCIIEDQNSNNHLIKCVLSDECMEYLDGSKSFKILKELEFSSKIKPVRKVSITSFDDEHSRNLLMERGADYVLNKPCSFSSLELILREIFVEV